MIACVSLLATMATTVVVFDPPSLALGWMEIPDDESISVACSDPLTMILAVKQQNTESVKKIAMAVSDPRSARYGQHLSTAQLSDLTQSTSSLVATTSWLDAVGITFRVSGGGTAVLVDGMSGAALASRLHTECRAVHHPATNRTTALLGAFAVPQSVYEHLAAAPFGVHELPQPDPRHGCKASRSRPVKGFPVTPAVLNSTYGMGDATGSGSTAVRAAVMEFNPRQIMLPSDLSAFFQQYVSGDTRAQDSTVYHFRGDNPMPAPAGSRPGTEASLDIEYIMG